MHGVVLAPAQAIDAESRTWTDQSGAVTKEGVLERVEGNWVYLKLEDGQAIRVPFTWLSLADQGYVTAALPGASPETATKRSSLSDAISSTATPSGADAKLRVVVVSGAGADVESAKRDAHREAVRQVVGAFVDSETLVKNDQLVEDRVVTLSAAFVEKSETLSTNSEGGIVRVRLKAMVKVTPLIASLRDNRIAVRPIDGQSLDAEQMTRLDQAQATLSLLPTVFPKFRSSCFQLEPVGKPRLGKVSPELSELIVTVQISPRLQEYVAVAKRLDTILSAAQRASGEIVSNGEKPLSEGYDELLDRVQRHGLENLLLPLFVAETDREELRKAISERSGKFGLTWRPAYFVSDPMATRTYGVDLLFESWKKVIQQKGESIMMFLVHADASGIRTRWKWYALSAEETAAITAELPAVARCITVLKDGDGQEITRDELKLNRVGAFGENWYGQNGQSWCVSPFIQYSYGIYSPRISIERRFRLSPEEIKRVAVVEAFFEDAPSIRMSPE